jgi:uncharacterized membrane protein
MKGAHVGDYVGGKPYDFGITVYDGKDTADKAFDAINALDKANKLKIHDAAVFTRTKRGKIKLKNKGYIATWKGGGVGLVIGMLLGGPVGGAVVGGLIGFGRGNDRRNLRGQVDEQLGMNNSALAVVLENTDWDALNTATKPFGGETVYSELQGSSLAQIEELTKDPEVTAAVEDEFDEVVSE